MDEKDPLRSLSGHVVICNGNPMVKSIVGELHAESLEEPPDIVLVIQDEELWNAHPEWHPEPSPSSSARYLELVGCITDQDVLDRIQISRARAAVILSEPTEGRLGDARSLLTAVAIEHQNPQVHTVLELIQSTNREFRVTIVNEVVCVAEVSENLIAQSCVTPFVKNIFRSLLSSDPDSCQIFLPMVPASLVGESYKSVARAAIVDGAPYLVSGFIQRGQVQKPNEHGADQASALYERSGEGDELSLMTFVINPKSGEEPGRDTLLAEGDRLIVFGINEPDLDGFRSPR